MLDNALNRLFQRRLNAHTQREQIHQDTLRSRQTVFNQIIEMTSILWPPNMPLIAPHVANVFAPSDPWGLRGPESGEGKQQHLSTAHCLEFTILPELQRTFRRSKDLRYGTITSRSDFS